MRVLFIHQNIPGQFRHLIAALCADPANDVWAIGADEAATRAKQQFPSLKLVSYAMPRAAPPSTAPTLPMHPWLAGLDAQVRRGQLVAAALRQMKDKGIDFDVIVAHPGWGEAMFVKDVHPDVPLLSYFEFFYAARGADVGFDPEFPAAPDDAERLRVRNLAHLSALNACDAGITPTRWQHARFPKEYQARIAVVHEGVDTDAIEPDATARLDWQGHVFKAGEPIVTYVARNLEPYRGFHVFMRALPALLAAEPTARVLIVGGDETSYGSPSKHAQDWRGTLLTELERAGTPLDPARVHFLGKLPRADYVKVLQVSAAHVYLTYPFVLSWSMLEAMAAGCLVIGSRTEPVTEVLVDGENGRLVDFFDCDALVAAMAGAFRDPMRGRAIRKAARATIVQRYDLKRRCLPAALKLIDSVVRAHRQGVASVRTR
jgi:glycosyltransferase involved in cell wall biosynthesis